MSGTIVILALCLLCAAITFAGAMGPRRPGPCIGKRCGD